MPNARRIICNACLSAFRPVGAGDALLHRARTRLSADGAIDDLTVLWYVDDTSALRTLIHRLKYGGAWRIGTELGECLGRALHGTVAGTADLIIPVPLHRSKFRERGFNQSAHIAKGIAAVTGQTLCEHALARVRWTPSQTTLGFVERRANMPGAFRISPRERAEVNGKEILLVDDVVTTGATLHACAAELKRAGASAIVASALALAA
jgi:ComF family protein